MKLFIRSAMTIAAIALTMLSLSASANEAAIKISMEIQQGETLTAKPIAVVRNGKNATLRVGSRSIDKVGDSEVVIGLLPTLQADDTVIVSSKIAITDVTTVDNQPVTTKREMTVEMKIGNGKESMMQIPKTANSEAITVKMRVDLVSEADIVAQR
jgi:hypothetical protein